jgi:hypothetical protein
VPDHRIFAWLHTVLRTQPLTKPAISFPGQWLRQEACLDWRLHWLRRAPDVVHTALISSVQYQTALDIPSLVPSTTFLLERYDSFSVHGQSRAKIRR